MRGSWTQPSLSRDFALLSAAILFILFLISAWVTFITYTRHTELIAAELEKEAVRIDRTLNTEMENANYLLTSLGREIVLDPERNLTKLAEMLKSFDSKGNIYTVFTWINPDQQVVVSSNKGVLDKPIDMADRDYVKKSLTDPWKMIIGRPVEGRVSDRWVIPVSMGITDYTGKFIGIIVTSIDISMLSDQISSLVRRDGISFAVVSKTLIPLTQVSDDKDFVTNNFPTQKLVNVNFTKNPRGLIAQGSLLWGTGSYAYYRVSNEYPYIILMGYDTHFSDESMRSMLWSRLLQVLVMAIFFVLFLWIIRTRMIKPVLDMTLIAAAVGKGEPYRELPEGGPMEIEALSREISHIGKYIEENKRIQDELRNKMFMIKNARERMQMDKRSKSEFLAYVCQEMRTPLNNVIGFAQVMKDQLYGPIENRKYRQYAADIYQTGNALLDNVQDVMTMSKAETDYIELSEKPLDVGSVINKVLRFVADKLQVEKLNVKVKLGDPMPRLVADEFRLQQILNNSLLYVLRHALPEGTILFEAKLFSENRDKQFFAITISTYDRPALSQPAMTALVARLMNVDSYARPSALSEDLLGENTDLSLELTKVLVAMHNGYFDVSRQTDGAVTITILFSGSRIRFVDSQ